MLLELSVVLSALISFSASEPFSHGNDASVISKVQASQLPGNPDWLVAEPIRNNCALPKNSFAFHEKRDIYHNDGGFADLWRFFLI